MTAHIIRRLFYMLIILFVMSIIMFTFVSLKGDPVAIMLGQSADQQTIAKMREQLGLDRPIVVQYLDWLSHIVRGDFGQSYTIPMSTLDVIFQRLPITIELTIFSMFFSLLVALPLGIVAALNYKSKLDIFLLEFSIVNLSMPNFWLGILLIFLFALKLKILPASGYVPFTSSPVAHLKLMILPVLTLSLWYIAVFMAFIRSTFIEVLQSEYILVAYSKGLREKRILWLHAFKNTLIPLVTVVGVNVSSLVGGAVVTETIFSLPGIGRLFVDSLFGRDMPLIMGIVLLTTVAVVVVNLMVDIVYTWIDPKIRYE
jgi:peptide/nickel transport system permease protein